MLRALGIETSCDETAVAVVDHEGRIEANLLSSQIGAHAPFGGVVPELASREHLRALPRLVEYALTDASRPVELVAVTVGPGLIGSLLVGVRFATAFAWARGLPLAAVDHLEGHLMSPFIDAEGAPVRSVPDRVLALVASGGHSSWYLMLAGEALRLCRTRDDAAGESFDKVAQALGLGYPGGPILDRLARRGDRNAVAFTRPRIKNDSLDFSFSGLKSAAIRWIRQRGLDQTDAECPQQEVVDLAASFEGAVVDQLLAPLDELVESHLPDLLTASGGVAANTLLRRRLREAGEVFGVQVSLSPISLTTDNAAMIAHRGQVVYRMGGRADPRRLDPWPRSAWQPPGMR